jgi:hypothetical protein
MEIKNMATHPERGATDLTCLAEVLPHRKCIGADQTVSVPGDAKRLLGVKN